MGFDHPMILLCAYLAAVIIDVAVMWHKLKQKKLIDMLSEASVVGRGTRLASYAPGAAPSRFAALAFARHAKASAAIGPGVIDPSRRITLQ